MTFPADSAENVTYTYDQSGHGDGVGRLTSVTDAAGTLSRSYDQFGNLLTDVRTTNAATLTTAYSYDAANRIASISCCVKSPLGPGPKRRCARRGSGGARLQRLRSLQ